MDTIISNIISSSFIIPLSLFVLLLAILFSWLPPAFSNPKSNPKINLNQQLLPPGPKKLPWIGNLHQLFSSVNPLHHFLADLSHKHGPIFHLQLGEISTFVVSSPEIAKDVLKTHDINFANRPSLIASEILFYKNSDIAFAPYGEYWRQMRKICTMELLSAKRVQSFRPLRQEGFAKLCAWIASKEGSSINLTEKLFLSTCHGVMEACLGNTTDELSAFIAIEREAAALTSGFCLADLYPSIKLFRLLGGTRRKAESLQKKVDRLLGKIIDDHRLANKDQSKLHEDLVDVLLKFNEPGNELYLTSDNIKAVLLNMFNAAIDTSATVVDWAMAEMLKNPKVMAKAQDEVRRVFSDKGFVDEAEIDELKYLKLVIKEALRLHAPGPLLLPRVNSEPCEVYGYEVPAKSWVIVNVWAIARDPKLWKDAESFIPERYDADNSTVDYKGNNLEYLPFGGGRRICPGMTFGLANVELPLAMLLYHFDWVLPEGITTENLDMTERYAVTAARKNPLYVIPIVKNRCL